MPAVAEREYLSTGEAALRLGVLEWQVARVYRQGHLPEPARLGRRGPRLVPVADLPRLAELLGAPARTGQE
jgi:hypothetical protein